jgi:ABC-2 type transport system ATP-binding protein
MQPAIVIKNVSVVLGGTYTALKHVSVDLPEGKVTGVIGPSGAGKTTLIRAIVGRQRVTKGSIHVLGLPAGSAPLRARMSYMTQGLSAYGDLTVQENLRYFAVMFGIRHKSIKPVIAEILHTIDMTSRAGKLVGTLSGGQKQRVSLAIALIGYPKLMVLDEPTVGLDPVLREQIWDLFRRLAANGTTLIVTSHVMDEAARCDDLLLIRDGTVLAHDSPTALCAQTNSKTVEQSFLRLVGASR